MKDSQEATTGAGGEAHASESLVTLLICSFVGSIIEAPSENSFIPRSEY